MILIDTSVWVDHLRAGDAQVADVLRSTGVLMHPFVLGEIALGNLVQRVLVLGSLADLPQAVVATDAEVMEFIERAGLPGAGIGYVDAHLLASARLTSARIWTRDRRLSAAAVRMGLAHAAA